MFTSMRLSSPRLLSLFLLIAIAASGLSQEHRAAANIETDLLSSEVSVQSPTRLLKRPPAKYDLSRIGHRGIGSGMNFFTFDREREMGKQLSQAAEATMKLFNDSVVYEYVNRIAQNIAINSDLKVPLVLKIVADDQVNAFSLPGGYVYVTTGLLNEADNEAQIAGVIGHEVAHIAARHGTRTVSKATFWASILRTAAVISPGGAIAEFPKIVGADFSANVLFAKMERGAEDEADLLAVEYAYSAGYDPVEYAVMFEKVKALQKSKPSAVARMFESHPATESRIRKVQRVIEDYLPDRDQYMVTSSGFDDMQTRMRGILDGRIPAAMQPAARPVLKKRSKWDPPQ
jgi:predicted Zn-dependent protease